MPESVPQRPTSAQPWVLMLLLAGALVTAGWAAAAGHRYSGYTTATTPYELIGLWQIVLLVCWGQLRPDLSLLRQLAALAATVALGSLIFPQAPLHEAAFTALSVYVGAWIPLFFVSRLGYQLLTHSEAHTSQRAERQSGIRSLLLLTLYCAIPLAYYNLLRQTPQANDLYLVVTMGGLSAGLCLTVLGKPWLLRLVGSGGVLLMLGVILLSDFNHLLIRFTAWFSGGLIILLLVCRIAGYRIVRPEPTDEAVLGDAVTP